MKYPLWKPILILAVVLLCAATAWFKGLSPGIDLAGGTTLTYAVQVPDGEDPDALIEQTIEILKERVDPSGVMNLIWRAEAGNRLTVQMAQAPPSVGQRRRAYEEARDALLAKNLPARAVRVALNAPAAQRAAEFDKLAAGNDELRAKLSAVETTQRNLEAAQAPYDAALSAYREATDAAGAEPSEQQAAELAQLEDDVFKLAAQVRTAKQAVDAALAEVLGENIAGGELQRVLELSTRAPSVNVPAPRAAALAELKQAHPTHDTELDRIAELYASYEQVKGPLDDPEDLIRLLQGAGILEFRIAAAPGGTDPVDVEAYVERLEKQGPRAGRDLPWRWFPIQTLDEYVEDPADRATLAEQPDQVAPFFADNFRLVARDYGGAIYVLLGNATQTALTGADDWSISSVGRTSDEFGRPAVLFGVNPRGAQLLGNVTGNHVQRQMGIVLDGQLISSPTLQSQLTSGGTITGDFSNAEVRYLTNTLRAGSLGAILSERPIAQQTTGPQLGQDNLNAGLRASILSLVIVGAFMTIYYLVPGVVAVVALACNMIVILGVLSLTSATFTLPGIAGLVLTIGMAVDANVLVFERIREELARKADLTTAVRLGFDKALSAIVDANLTSLLTCVVLFYTATSEIKGFAVVLGVGILSTMFTALFLTRTVIELGMIYGGVKSLPMLPSSWDRLRRFLEPDINWLTIGKFILPVSLLTTVGGLAVLYARGADVLDIEFRSGTEVVFSLSEGEAMPIEEARQRLATFAENAPPVEGVNWNHLAEASVVTVGNNTPEGSTGFKVATLIEDAPAMSEAIKAAFTDVLDTTRPIDFAGLDLTADAAKGLVEPVRTATLGDNLNRPSLTADVGDYLGGVAILLDDLTPAATVEDLEQRITRMRRQPGFENLGYRRFAVFGVEPAGVNDRGVPVYAAAALVATDNLTNYIEKPDALGEPDGLAATEWGLVRAALQSDTSLDSVSNFSSQVSGTMQQRAIVALALSMVVIVLYIALRFGSVRYSLGAAASLVHDTAFTLGILAICGWIKENDVAHFLLLDNFKINLAVVAALLTLIGYSLNDTIVVYDRIRENRGRLARASPAIINASINQTFSRTILTSGTTMMAVMLLYVFGGPGVHGFAFVMMVGVAVGTYSSVAIAAPLLLLGYKDPGAGAGATLPATTAPRPVSALVKPAAG